MIVNLDGSATSEAMSPTVTQLDRYLDETPDELIDNSEFLIYCVNRKHHQRNNLACWNYLYKHYRVEYCPLRRRLFERAHNRSISGVSSTDLCFCERYSGCVNFVGAKDGLLRHVCDILPIVIGSDIDLEIRRDFWQRGRPCILEDVPKIGFIIQNKNYYNFTSCLTTNPKVCHIYRRNAKLQNTEVRLYFYDHNFRGNKLYLKQQLVFEKCDVCLRHEIGDCTMRMYVLETLMLRSCFKHDYVFISRRCETPESHRSVRETIAWLCGYRGNKTDNSTNLTYRRPTCRDIFPQGGLAQVLRVQCSKNASSFVLCDCPSSGFSRQRCVDDVAKTPCTDSSALRFENIDKMIELNDTCFLEADSSKRQDNAAVMEKMFVLFVYMHDVLIRNEDIDLLCNKCIFDGPILYGLLMQQLSSYVCEKYPLTALFTDVIDTLINKMREFSHTGNLYMLISRKTNIRVDLTNDMKRLLKKSVRCEKNQNIDVCSNVKTYASASVVPSSGHGGNQHASENGGSVVVDDEKKLTDAVSSSSSQVASMIDKFAANVNSDFLLRRKKQRRSVMFDRATVNNSLANAGKEVGAAAAMTNKIFYTGLDPFRPKNVLMLYSSIRDYNTRQLLNYGNLQYLLQGISAPHYTDNEFLAEQIKRPPIATQQNSSRCACIPRSFQRFISFYQIGNLSTAGRFMNKVARTRLSFFVHPVVRVAEQYFAWFRECYSCDLNFRAKKFRRNVERCVAHDLFRCRECFLFLIINEMPYCNVLVDKHLEYQLFLLSKLRWPAIQFYRKSNDVLSISIQSGILMLPVCISFQHVLPANWYSPSTVDCSHRWKWCHDCGLYFPTDERFISSTFQLTRELLYSYNNAVRRRTGVFADGMLTACRYHVWFSPNDYDYYDTYHSTVVLRDESLSPRPLPQPLQYEIVCHGAFSCGRFISSVDISKIIVSINASKRRLRLGSSLASRDSSKSPFESIMDQNARIVVYPDVSGWREAVFPTKLSTVSCVKRDFMVLREDGTNEPLENIVVVPGRNSFFACFSFGDYGGFNCEDAYVVNERCRPLVENVVELKASYYKFDRSVIKTNRVQFKFDPSVHLNPGCGCTIKLGLIRSYYKLSFSSTMITVGMSSVRNIYYYTLSYTSNSAYLQRDLQIFRNILTGERGCDFFDPVVQDMLYDDARYDKHNSKSNMLMLYDGTATSLNGNIVISVQMSTRHLRFRVSLKNVRTTQKTQNNCGQKGMPVYRDLSDFYTERGGQLHLIVSSYSLLGRQPLAQLQEQRSMGGCSRSFGPMLRVFSRRLGNQQVGWAGYGEFFFSCDSPHDNIVVSRPNCGNNPMRVCNLTYYAAIDSGLSTAIFHRISDHENYKNNPSNGMPLNIAKLLSVYRFFNRDIEIPDFRARRLREQFCDWVNLQSFDVQVELPDRLKDLLLIT